jgi:hypothetical protein
MSLLAGAATRELQPADPAPLFGSPGTDPLSSPELRR